MRVDVFLFDCLLVLDKFKKIASLLLCKFVCVLHNNFEYVFETDLEISIFSNNYNWLNTLKKYMYVFYFRLNHSNL